MGTLGIDGALRASLRHTTPDPITLHGFLAAMREQQITHAVLEASSHGLAQYRLDGVKLKAAAFSSFSRDHLDYHDDLDSYFFRKGPTLFRSVALGGISCHQPVGGPIGRNRRNRAAAAAGLVSGRP